MTQVNNATQVDSYWAILNKPYCQTRTNWTGYPLSKYLVLMVDTTNENADNATTEHRDAARLKCICEGMSIQRVYGKGNRVVVLFFDIYLVRDLNFLQYLIHLKRKIIEAVSGNKYFGKVLNFTPNQSEPLSPEQSEDVLTDPQEAALELMFSKPTRTPERVQDSSLASPSQEPKA